MKAQTTIVSSILLVGIVIGLVSTTYMWGKPMFEKSSSISSYEYSKTKLMEIKKTALLVSKTKDAQQSVTVDGSAILTSIEAGEYAKNVTDPAKNISGLYIHKNAIDFTQTLGMPLVQSDAWVFVDPEEDNSNFIGNMGSDSAGVLLARSDGANTITRLWFRDLYDSTTGKYYRVNLSSAGATSASGSQSKLSIKNLGTAEVQISGQSYIVTNLQASLG